MSQKRILILGGGFAGLYAAKTLEKLTKDRNDIEITLINRDNYFVYQPMLAEIISGNVGVTDTVSPLRSLLHKANIVVREVEYVDLENKVVVTSPGFKPVRSEIEFDYLVVALGNVTDFRGMTGLTQHALRFKYLSDALTLRNHVIRVMEEAAVETNPKLKEALLTFVVGGGGWSGVECIAELNDFVRHVAKKYKNIDTKHIRMVLLQSADRILLEMDEGLAKLAEKVLIKAGVEIKLKTRLAAATGDEAILDSGERISTKTLISTVPGSTNPVVDDLELPKSGGRGNQKIKVDLTMQVEGRDDVWAIGDCAMVPQPGDTTGKLFCPPTAQHAVREGELCAKNILAQIDGKKPGEFDFTGLGQMGALGHQSAVAQLKVAGQSIKLSGIIAWMMWRAVYLMKLPGWDRRLRTAIAWITSTILPTDSVGLKFTPAHGVVQEHYQPGQYVFNQGDLGDRLFIIIKGKAEVIRTDDRISRKLAELTTGQYFGEMALLVEGQATRGAAVRATEPLDVLSVPKQDITALVEYLPALRESFDEVIKRRQAQNDEIVRRSTPKRVQDEETIHIRR